MKSHARVVIIGGGVTGCSILYHLAKMGWSDVILLERSELTSGSTWHAAGNLFSLTSPSAAQKMQVYTINLYGELEAESGQSVGYHPTGGLNLASTDEEVMTLKIARTHARRNGVEAEFISFEEARDKAPILNTDTLKAVMWEPLKGHVDPSSATQAYAAAARKNGAKIYRECPVIETSPTKQGGWEVVTPKGTFTADYLINAAGLWAREVGALAGINFPLLAVEHHYLVTETIDTIAKMTHELPTISDAEAGFYSRQEGQGILLGAYEDKCHHWAINGTPLDFGHELLPDDLERMEKNFERAANVIPVLGEAGIKRIINGPMIFSPDLAPMIGPHPDLANYFCAVGAMTGFIRIMNMKPDARCAPLLSMGVCRMQEQCSEYQTVGKRLCGLRAVTLKCSMSFLILDKTGLKRWAKNVAPHARISACLKFRRLPNTFSPDPRRRFI